MICWSAEALSMMAPALIPCVLMWQWPAAGLPPSVTLLEPRRK